MRAVRLFVVAALVGLGAHRALAQSSNDAGGLLPGGYLRVAGGTVAPSSDAGLHDWLRGPDVAVSWETWEPGDYGSVDWVAYSLQVEVGLLRFNEAAFKSDFQTGTPVLTASSSGAFVWTAGPTFRIRLPVPVIMPSINLGLGVIGIQPRTIHYTYATGSSTTSEQNRTGAYLSIGGSLERQIYGAFGVYGEATYAYGFTNSAAGFAQTAGSICSTSACEAARNSQTVSFRGGLRIRLGR